MEATISPDDADHQEVLDGVPITVSWFHSDHGKTPTQESLTWGELVERLSTHKPLADKHDAAVYSPASYKPDTTRGKANVDQVYVAVCDVDNDPEHSNCIGLQDFLRLVDGYECLIVSTYSSTPDRPKWRALILLATPCPASWWDQAWDRIWLHVFGTAGDRSCKDASRLYYEPSHPLNGPEPFVIYRPGIALDWTALPDVPRAPQMPREPEAERSDAERQGLPGTDFTRRTTWTGLLEDDGWTYDHDDGEETYWTRPGKQGGTSATTNRGGSDLLWIFSSSVPGLEPDRSYDRFGYYAATQHDGDHRAAARALAEEGYGSPDGSYEMGSWASNSHDGLKESNPSDTISAGLHTSESPPYQGDGSKESKPTYQFIDLDELMRDEHDVDWIVPGILAPGLLTILSGPPKLAGKSTLTAAMIGAIQRGESFLDLDTQRVGGVVVLTEEAPSSLKEKARRFGWQRQGLSIMTRYSIGTAPRIAVAIDKALAEAQRIGAKVLVLDSLGFWSGIKEPKGENDSSVMQVVMNQLVLAAGRGLAVLVIHHSTKSGEDLRGSSAIAANVDAILTLNRTQGDCPTRRCLEGVGRFDAIPSELVIELDGDGYHAVGSKGLSVIDYRMATIEAVVLDAGAWLTHAEILDRWPTTRVGDKKPTLKQVGDAAAKLVEHQRLLRKGGTSKVDPYRYAPPSVSPELKDRILDAIEAMVYSPTASDLAEWLDVFEPQIIVALRELVAEGRVRRHDGDDPPIYDLTNEGTARKTA